MLSGDFRREVAMRRTFGLEDERLRKVARVLMRTPEVRAEGFDFVAADFVSKGRGGLEVGAVDVTFLVFAALASGPINEALGALSWRLYSAPYLDLLDEGETKCPVTGATRAGDAVRNILASPDALAKRVRGIGLWREGNQVSVHWPKGEASLFQHGADQPPKGALRTIATIPAEALRWLAEVTRGAHPITRRH